MMKKGIIRIAVSSVLVVIMLMQCFPVLALSGADVLSADSSALIKFNIEDVSGKPGDTVEVKISVSGEAEVSGLLLHMLTYDESALEFVEFKSGALVDSSLTKDASINGKTITLGYENNIIPNGEICTAVFSIKSTAEDGKYTIGFSRISASNNGREVSSELTAGTVTVSKWLVGDFDENGIVDMRDAVHFIGWVNFSYIPDLYPMVYDGNKDFNDDGTVDMQDAVYLIGWINFSFTGLYDIDWYGKGKCNHSMQHISAKAATCTEDGNIEYWHCDECGKYFSDAEGKTEITANETVLAQTGHMEVIDAAVLPTYDSTGLTEGSHCSKCGKILKNQDVIPKLEATYHSIIYKDTKGAEIPVDKMRYSEHEGLLDLPVISADGYTFKGWYTASEGGTKVDHIIKGSKDDKVLYAHWELVKYTITYKDAPIKNNQTEFTIEDEIVLNDPEWVGLAFKNWTDDNGNVVTKIKKGTIGNITITANWMSERNLAIPSNSTKAKAILFDEKVGRYYFIYDIGTIENIILSTLGTDDKSTGETLKWNISETVNVENDVAKTVAKTVSTSVSQTNGWNKTREWTISHSESISSSITAGLEVEELGLKAKLEATIGKTSSTGVTGSREYGTSGSNSTGSETSDSVSSTVSYKKGISTTIGKEITIPGEMPKGKYSYVCAGTVHVYAVVTYDPTERNYYVDTFSIMDDDMYEKRMYDAPANTTANITSSEGLSLNIGNYEEEIQTYVNSVYTVNYDANGGEGEMHSSLHKVGEKSTLQSNSLSRAGYVFTGWGISSNGGVLYPDNAEITDIAERGTSITLYAIWSAKPYKAMLNLSASKIKTTPTLNTASVDVIYDSKARLPVPTADFYEFTGWYSDESWNNRATDCEGNMLNVWNTAKNITLYAGWKKLDKYKDYTYINSKSEFISISPTGNTLLVADIDMGNYEWNMLDEFSGKLDGAGHTISNLGIKTNGAQCLGLFAKNTGVIENLVLSNIVVNYNVSGSHKDVSIGVIAGYNSGTIQNCIVKSSNITCWLYNNIGTWDVIKVSTGGIAGKNDSVIYKCSTYNISILGQASIDVSDGAVEANSGGIVGMNIGSGSVKMCNANNNGIKSVVYGGKTWTATRYRTYARAGGIAGYNSAKIQSCSVSGNTLNADYSTVQGSYPDNYNSTGNIAGKNDGEISN